MKKSSLLQGTLDLLLLRILELGPNHGWGISSRLQQTSQDGLKTSQDYFYAHLIAPPPVGRRERVRTGQYVGRVGKTGNAASTPCHLHFEIRVHGHPVDPEPYLHDWDKHS